MKIGIMGGTFDPIHIGHLMLGEFAHEIFSLDKVWFMPNGNPPHKKLDLINISVKHRVEMTKLAIEDTEYFGLELFEINNPEISFSYHTLEHFKHIFPNDEFYFILGADSLFSIDHWKEPQRLFNTCTILAAIRDDKGIEDMQEQISYLKSKYQVNIELLRAPLLEISSSVIRERAANNHTIKFMVPDSVALYIKANNLYKDKNNG